MSAFHLFGSYTSYTQSIRPHMEIFVKRIYEPPSRDDGYRVLVDRIWPRGVSKDAAQIDQWMKSIAPSASLRSWFNHEPEKWQQFKKRYFAELRTRKEDLRSLLSDAGDGRLTLLYGAREQRYNNAVALREYLNRMKS